MQVGKIEFGKSHETLAEVLVRLERIEKALNIGKHFTPLSARDFNRVELMNPKYDQE